MTGKGFTSEIVDKARCRFGIDSNFAVVEAEVFDYTKLVCHSPSEFNLPEGADTMFSVPFGIAFNDEEFRPWTIDTTRFRFYPQPEVVLADPDEVKIGKLTEIFVWAAETSFFWEPIPVNN